jgi:crotonobetainyl-CoA:carnitine CoA-transferase CaiB-like acyl-CoA transferase
VRLTHSPAEVGDPAPALGEHPDASFSSSWRATASAGPAPGQPPLAGVTVLELAWFYAAPFGTALLADLGARVIRVEGHDGDPHRWQFQPPEFAAVKAVQGKESVIIDYRTPEGTEVLHRLVRQSDMVMRNFRQLNSVQTGDDYDSLAAVNPDLVYLYAGAYGADGPYGTRPAFAPTMSIAAGFGGHLLGWESAMRRGRTITFDEGMAELAEISKVVGGPVRPPTNNGDAGPALVVATGMLLGLLARQRTGEGQYAETSMLCSNAYAVSDSAFDPGDETTFHDENGTGPLYRLYPASEGWVFLAAPDADDWSPLRDAVRQATDGRGTDRGARNGLRRAAGGRLGAVVPRPRGDVRGRQRRAPRRLHDLQPDRHRERLHRSGHAPAVRRSPAPRPGGRHVGDATGRRARMSARPAHP